MVYLNCYCNWLFISTPITISKYCKSLAFFNCDSAMALVLGYIFMFGTGDSQNSPVYSQKGWVYLQSSCELITDTELDLNISNTDFLCVFVSVVVNVLPCHHVRVQI